MAFALCRTKGLDLSLAVGVLHAAAFTLGYFLCKGLKFDEKTARTVSIETGVHSGRSEETGENDCLEACIARPGMISSSFHADAQELSLARPDQACWMRRHAECRTGLFAGPKAFPGPNGCHSFGSERGVHGPGRLSPRCLLAQPAYPTGNSMINTHDATTPFLLASWIAVRSALTAPLNEPCPQWNACPSALHSY